MKSAVALLLYKYNNDDDNRQHPVSGVAILSQIQKGVKVITRRTVHHATALLMYPLKVMYQEP